nr:MAG TPA: hypothetical protein [Caudoviricetes sp.]
MRNAYSIFSEPAFADTGSFLFIGTYGRNVCSFVSIFLPAYFSRQYFRIQFFFR